MYIKRNHLCTAAIVVAGLAFTSLSANAGEHRKCQAIEGKSAVEWNLSGDGPAPIEFNITCDDAARKRGETSAYREEIRGGAGYSSAPTQDGNRPQRASRGE